MHVWDKDSWHQRPARAIHANLVRSWLRHHRLCDWPVAWPSEITCACWWWTLWTHAVNWIFIYMIHQNIFSERELTFTFAMNVNSRSRSLYAIARPSVCRLSVCNVRAPYSGNWNFQQYFCGVGYLGHPLTSTKNFTEIVPGEPLRRGSWTQEG